MTKNISTLNPKENILIKGASLHNLKNVDLAIPRNKLVVITGLSGSGKSSLAFDTLYAEGQRRYVESLSSYAKQFLGKLNKPKVDFIKGIAPAIAIEQKVNTTNSRSTVGTATEIYDYLKLLFARIGKTYSPISNREVKKHRVNDVINFVKKTAEGTKLLLMAPIVLNNKKDPKIIIKLLSQQGYSRIKINDTIIRLDDTTITKIDKKELQIAAYHNKLYLIIDRIVVKEEEEEKEGFYHRLADAIQTAFFEGKGTCVIETLTTSTTHFFSNLFELDGITFLEPNTHFFSFNNPHGACPTCEGYGSTIGIDPKLVIPNTALSIYNDAIAPWKTKSFSKYKEKLIDHAYKFKIPIHKPWFELTSQQKELIWEGTSAFKGLHVFFKYLEKKSYKIQYRVILSRYRGRSKCKSCKGKRLRKETDFVKINDCSISDLVNLPIDELTLFFKNLSLNKNDQKIADRLIIEINDRLSFLNDVGLSYLNLNRASNTLSGGESQRINLATSLGSSLIGSMYILDEPSIGLHPKDTKRLIKILKKLKNIGNTVIVVEHDEDIIREADLIIDIGPEAGTNGGRIVAEGTIKQLLKSDSLTAKYLNHQLEINIPSKRKTSKNKIYIKGARANNLKNISLEIPLNVLTVITGVSGSGKSTLVKEVLYPALQKKISDQDQKAIELTELSGNFDNIKEVVLINQNPIGKSSRSNPVTYIKAYDEIRNLFASQNLSKIRNYKPKHFSFNVEGGRCETCKGEGEVTIEMQFMADVHLECEDCKGRRFKKSVLEIKFHKKSIDDILKMTIEDAIAFFNRHEQTKITKKLGPLLDVGLSYVQLGQSSSTLSGGEAQRIKLASFLARGTRKEKTLFIFDEPTTGLHFHDVKKLLNALEALLKNGHSVIVIEHNVEFIKCADYIIDLGPEGGKKGGNLVFTGTPEEMVKNSNSSTADFLRKKINIKG